MRKLFFLLLFFSLLFYATAKNDTYGEDVQPINYIPGIDADVEFCLLGFGFFVFLFFIFSMFERRGL